MLNPNPQTISKLSKDMVDFSFYILVEILE